MKDRNVIFTLSAVLLLGSVPARAQRATASVAGSVTDASDAAVPGASVNVRNSATGLERSVVTNDLGYYVITALPSGGYTVTVTKPGFQTQTISDLTLEVDQNATVNLSMKIGV